MKAMSRGFSGVKIAVELDCKQSLFCSTTCKREYLSSKVARVARAFVFASSQLEPSQLARLRCSNTLTSKRETARSLRSSLFILDNRKGTTLFLKTITANYGWKWSFLLFWIQQRPQMSSQQAIMHIMTLGKTVWMQRSTQRVYKTDWFLLPDL